MAGYDPYYGKINTRGGWGLFLISLVFIAFHLSIWGGVLKSLHAAGASPGTMGEASATMLMPFAVCVMVIGGCWLIGVSSRMPAYLALCVMILAVTFWRGGRPEVARGETLRGLPGMAAFTQCQKEMFLDLEHQFMKHRRCKENEQELARYAELARAAKIDDKEAVAVIRAIVVVMNELGGQLDQQAKAIDRLKGLCSGTSAASIFAFTDLDQLNQRIESTAQLRSVYREAVEYRKRIPDRLRTVLVEKGADQSRAPDLATKIRDKHFFEGGLEEAIALASRRLDLVTRRLTLLRDNWGKWTRDAATGDVVAEDPQIQAQASKLLKQIRDIEASLDQLAAQILAGRRQTWANSG